jgi:adenylate cyclase
MPYTDRYEQWLSHWLIAKLAQWCKEDFELSVAEVNRAVKLLPFDATTRADMAELMSNAGYSDIAIEWLHESIRRDPTGPEWYRGNLAWAYYLSGRYGDALAELRRLNKPKLLLQAAVYIKLGRIDEARFLIETLLKEKPHYSLTVAARWPMTASLKRHWLKDQRLAGLPER